MIELHYFFDSDIKKVSQWLHYKNLNLGNQRPLDLIKSGTIQRLHKFVLKELDI